MLKNLLFCLVIMASSSLSGQEKLKIMLITGGHDFDRPEFFAMFQSFERVDFEEVVQPLANEYIASGKADEYDLLVFYDMYDSITDQQKQGYLQLVEQKKPMLFLHHSLVSYQKWSEFAKILGGKYHTKDPNRLSNYKHDEEIAVHVVSGHPITRGVKHFTFIDETYGNCEILPGVQPLLKTDHPKSMPLLGWVNRYRGHDIVFLQGGHGPTAYQDPHFRQIVRQAIYWCVDEAKQTIK